MTAGSFVPAPARFSPRVFPVTVMQSGFMSPGTLSNSARIAGIPPARSTSSMWYEDDGATLHSVGVLREMASMRARSYGTPASCATASAWRIVFVEPPIAMSSASALSKASRVAMSRGFTSFSINSISRNAAAR